MIQFKFLIELLDCALLGNPIGSYIGFLVETQPAYFICFFRNLVIDV